MKKSDEEGIDFEKAVAELEKIVKQLESGNLPLEESLAMFERGVGLARSCRSRLDAAELRIAKLVKDKDGLFKEETVEQ